jgi:hypothetical protein
MCVEFPFNEFHKGPILATILVCCLTKLFLSSEGRELEFQFQAIKQASTEFLAFTFVLPQFSQELHSLMFEECKAGT